MSDYLYNLVARSFGLVETAQPRTVSIFEPPRAFRPVDSLQSSARAVEASAAAADEGERGARDSSASVQAVAPSPTVQPADPDSLPSINIPAARSETERLAAHQARVRGERLSLIKAAQGEESESSQMSSEMERRPSERTPAAALQPSPQRETQARTQPGTAPPASTRADIPVVTNGAQAETNAGSDDSTRQRQMPAQRSPAIAQVTEQRIVERALERALSTERSPALLKNDASAHQPLPGLSQRMKVAAFDRLQQQPDVTVPAAQQRRETLIVEPQVSRYTEAQAQGSLQQTRAVEPEQIVQVTIGRIEVRAAAPQPAQARAQKGSAQQPSQSLEEYLRQRAQGSGSR